MAVSLKQRSRNRQASAVVAALAIAFAVSCAFAGGATAPPSAATLLDPSGSSLVGVWKMSYDPQLQGVQEIDSHYLIILPGLSYIRIVDVGVRRLRVIEGGSLRIDGNRVTFVPGGFSDATGADARPPNPTAETLYYSPEEKVVFFDDRKTPAVRQTLRRDWTLNYSYARAF